MKTNSFQFSPYKVGICVIVASFLIIIIPNVSHASTNISSTDKYAWGNTLGWINFAPTKGNVTVTDSAITGYAWSEQYGWINLSPVKGGVLNDGNGTLSGYAWGEQTGWIDFSGVTIDSSGTFKGEASGTISGTIIFDCPKCAVNTTWRVASPNIVVAGDTTTHSSSGSRSIFYNPLGNIFSTITNLFHPYKSNPNPNAITEPTVSTNPKSPTTKPYPTQNVAGSNASNGTSTGSNIAENPNNQTSRSTMGKVVNVVTTPFVLIWKFMKWIFGA